MQYGYGYFWRQRREAADLIQLYRTGVPAQVIIHNTPQDSLQRHERRPGHLRAGLVDGRPLHDQPGRAVRALQQLDRRALGVGAGRFVPARTLPARANVPNWNDISPRLGFAWDVQGNGKTAVKVGFGKYVRAYSSGFADTYDPNFYTSRDADLERPEQRRHRAGRHQYRPTARACRALPHGRLRDRLLDPAGHVRRRSRRRTSRRRHQAAVPDTR